MSQNKGYNKKTADKPVIEDNNVQGTYIIDFNATTMYVITLTGATTLVFANIPPVTDRQITVRITGDFPLTINSDYVDINSEIYDGTQVNLIACEGYGGLVYTTNRIMQ